MPIHEDKQSTFQFAYDNRKSRGDWTKRFREELSKLTSVDPEIVEMLAWTLEENEKSFLKGDPSEAVTGTKKRIGTGLIKYRLRNEGGGFDEFTIPDNVQATVPDLSSNHDSQDVSSLRQSVLDATTSFDDRVSALHSWLSRSPDDVATFVKDQLQDQQRLEPRWHAELVRVSEATVFQDSDLELVAGLLFQSANFFRHRDELSSAESCWSALQRAASLVPIERVGILAEFLTNDAVVDTRLAGLQAIYSVLELSPDIPADSRENLMNRVLELGVKTLDPDVFVAGELSAIGIEATVVLSILSQDFPNRLIDAVIALNRDWVIDNVASRYHELIEVWKENAIRPEWMAVMLQESERLVAANL